MINGGITYMENKETNPVESKSPVSACADTNRRQPAALPRPDILYLIICLFVSLVAGAISGCWFSRVYSVDVYVVDVKGIVEAKKKELIEKYKKSPTDETIVTADKDLSEFLVLLDKGITDLGKEGNRLILLKDIYLAGDVTDATETLANNLKAIQQTRKVQE